MSDPIPTLVCTCGHVMKAPGAKPGRVGKCTKCGALVKVPAWDSPTLPEPARQPKAKAATLPTSEENAGEPDPPRRSSPVVPTSGGYGVASKTLPDSAFASSSDGRRPVGTDARPIRPPDLGPVKAPVKSERTLGQSFAYPLWSWSSVGMLAFMPVILVMTTSPIEFLVQSLFSDSAFVVPAYISLIPVALLMTLTMGYVLIYFGNILLSSAAGDVIPPRPPTLEDDIPRAVGRWVGALLGGGLLGGLPAYVYWLNCGEIDWIDRLMFFNLSVIGVAYAQLALLSVLLHEDPLAANPVTVLKAFFRLGTSYIGICLLTISALALLVFLLAMVAKVENSVVHLILYWAFWAFAVYLGMVVFRRLGLYCHRHKLIQTWFADRPRWGVGR